MIGVKILKGRAACLLKTISLLPPHSYQSNIYFHLKDIFKKPSECLDFCFRLLEFNIFRKTNYIHRKNTQFRKISLIMPTSENKVLFTNYFLRFIANWGARKRKGSKT